MIFFLQSSAMQRPQYFSGRAGWKLIIAMVVFLSLSCASDCLAGRDGELLGAAQRFDVKTASALLKSGENVNERDALGRTPLHLASDRANAENYLINSSLHASGLSESEKAGIIESRQNEMVRLLLSSGADINAQDSEEMTPLMIAVSDLNMPLIRLLLSSGADANIKSKMNGTVLLIAIAFESAQVVQMLVEKGADVNMRLPSSLSPSGYINPLSFAMSSGNREITDILKKAGARP